MISMCMKFETLIKEMNLYTKSDLKQELETVVGNKTDNNYIKKWFFTKFVNWYVSNEDDLEKQQSVKPHTKVEGEEDWAEGTFDFVGFSPSEINTINHWIDYMEVLPEKELKKLDRLTVRDIKKRVKEWDDEVSSVPDRGKAKGNIFTSVKKVISTNGKSGVKTLSNTIDYNILEEASIPNHYWVQHLTMASLEAEGTDLGHCIGRGGYSPTKTFIVSLWDSNGNSSLTINMDKKMGTILELQGAGNSAPHAKYIPVIKDFVIENKINIGGNGEYLGMNKFDSKYYWPDSKEWKDIYDSKIIPLQNDRFKQIVKNIV